MYFFIMPLINLYVYVIKYEIEIEIVGLNFSETVMKIKSFHQMFGRTALSIFLRGRPKICCHCQKKEVANLNERERRVRLVSQLFFVLTTTPTMVRRQIFEKPKIGCTNNILTFSQANEIWELQKRVNN